MDIAFSPVVERKGGLCAVVRQDGKQVALVGLDSPDRSVILWSGSRLKHSLMITVVRPSWWISPRNW